MNAYERVMARSRVEERGYETPCRIFTNRLHPAGYGRLFVGRRANGSAELRYAHVIVYEHHHGPIPDGLEVDHLCRQRDCHEVTHLEAVTRLVNVQRGEASEVTRARHAAQTHCKRGHEYTAENTGIQRLRGIVMGRYCRTCRAEGKRRRAVA